MIYSDRSLIEWGSHGGLKPFCKEHVNPASVDLTLSSIWIDFHHPGNTFTSDSVTLYPRTVFVDIYNFFAGLLGRPRMLTVVVAMTREWVNIDNGMAGMVKLKSSRIREGLGYPIADWVDPGYSGHLTLILTAYRKVTIYEDQRIVQLVVEAMEESDNPYYLTGHYMNQREPTLSRSNNGA